MIFDTHAHYDDEAFDEDREVLIGRFEELGIGAVTDPGSTKESIAKIIELTERHKRIYGALGIHPSECGEMTEEDLEEIRRGLHLPKMVAVGEIGLDYHWDTPERELQRHWFRRQLELAGEENMPVIIHSRDAAADTLSILKECGAGETGGVIHCYSYSPELASEFLKLGFFLGIGGVVTFRNGKKTQGDRPGDAAGPDCAGDGRSVYGAGAAPRREKFVAFSPVCGPADRGDQGTFTGNSHRRNLEKRMQALPA